MINLDQCNPTLRERIQRQMSVEDAAKQPVFSHTEGSGSDLNSTGGVQTLVKQLKRLKRHLSNEVKTDSLPLGSEPQSVVSDVTVGTASGEARYPRRIGLRITSFRRKLLDPDNLIGGSKYFIDGLRYAGIILGDQADQITLTVEQQKTQVYERTEIEIDLS